jgi:microcystin degradation protein MlrC
MRLAVGQLWQETNTFNRNATTLADFENWGIATGTDVLREFGETGELGGFVSGVQEWASPPELVGLARFLCWPYGRVDREAWKAIQETFLTSLDQAGKLDGVLISLHGAMAAEGEDDVSGALLELIRWAIGPETPLVGSLDLHANVTRRIVAQADLLVGYHTQPHLDQFETGVRAARGLRSIIELQQRPFKYRRKLPMITAAESHSTFTGPPAPLYRRLVELEREPKVLSAGLYMAMPWLDCKELGWTVTLHTATKDVRWEDTVAEIADSCWNLRGALSDVERFSAEEVVAKCLSHGGHPIVIGDGADATNSGAPGDSTALLRELIKQQPIPRGAMTFLVDPEAVAHAEQVGVAGAFDAFVGGKLAPEFSQPLHFRGVVERLLSMQYELNGALGRNMPVQMGRSAVVRSGDVTVVFTERSGPGSSPLLYETAGLKPRECGIVVAKSPTAFRAEYEPFVAAAFIADCPGCASPNLSHLIFRKVNQPLWPLQEISSSKEAEWCQTY